LEHLLADELACGPCQGPATRRTTPQPQSQQGLARVTSAVRLSMPSVQIEHNIAAPRVDHLDTVAVAPVLASEERCFVEAFGGVAVAIWPAAALAVQRDVVGRSPIQVKNPVAAASVNGRRHQFVLVHPPSLGLGPQSGNSDLWATCAETQRFKRLRKFKVHARHAADRGHGSGRFDGAADRSVGGAVEEVIESHVDTAVLERVRRIEQEERAVLAQFAKTLPRVARR
jgi:hypothetical protein